MRRRVFAATTLVTLSWPALAGLGAEQSRIAVLAGGATRQLLEPLFAELSALGYPERNIEQHYEWEGLSIEAFRSIARDVVRRQPDVIVAFSNVDVESAKAATSTIPIVMVLSSTPVESGFIATLHHPGANVTGTTVQSTVMGAKLIELLKQVAPRASTVGLLWEPSFPGMHLYYQEALRGAASLGVRYQEFPVTTERELNQALDAIRQRRPDALYVALTGQLYSHWQRIIDLAAELRLPAIYTEEPAVRDGALMSYSADRGALMRRTASYVDRILKGAKPADLPVEEPSTFTFAINLKTAEALGLAIPPPLLLRATTVIGR